MAILVEGMVSILGSLELNTLTCAPLPAWRTVLRSAVDQMHALCSIDARCTLSVRLMR